VRLPKPVSSQIYAKSVCGPPSPLQFCSARSAPLALFSQHIAVVVRNSFARVDNCESEVMVYVLRQRVPEAV
jgi:hypothetical protein